MVLEVLLFPPVATGLFIAQVLEERRRRAAAQFEEALSFAGSFWAQRAYRPRRWR
jgi:hypothetical protein